MSQAVSQLSDTQNLAVLPHGWVWTRLGEVTIVASGGTPSTKEAKNFGGDIPWITPADLSGYKGKYISAGARNITETGLKSSSATLLPKDTVILSSRAPVGYVAIAANELCTNQGCKNFIIVDGIFNEYLYYYLKASKSLAEEYSSGTTFLELSARKAANLPFPLPPFPEQHRIGAKIEELFTRLDAGVEALNKIKTQLKRYRQAVLRDAFQGKLTQEWREAHKGELEPASVFLERIKEERKKNAKGRYKEPPPLDKSDLPELPKGWVWTTVGAVADSMKNGIYKPPQFYAETGVACLRMYNIEDGVIVWKDIKRMGLTPDEVREYELRPGDILVNRVNSRELVGKAATIPVGLETCVYESKNIRLRVLSDYVESKYVSLWFQIFSQQYFDRHAQQTVGMASINQQQLGSMPLSLAPTPEQHKIVEEIERHLSIASEMEKIVDQSLKQMRRLRQSILQRAFVGKLVPQNSSDEPAEKLLERIREERAKQ